jgi:hypothetical protein
MGLPELVAGTYRLCRGHAGAARLYASFTLFAENGRCAGQFFTVRGGFRMVGIAIAIFIALFGWGGSYFGWSDPHHKVQLALAASFILGILSGYRAKS